MTAIVTQNPTPPYLSEGSTPQLATLTFQAVATGSTHTFPVGVKGTILLIQNSNATTAVTVTIPGTNDPFGRVAPITAFSVAAGLLVQRLFLPQGWESSNGSGIANFTVSGSGLEVAALVL
jgi:hypothetical protein